CVYCRRPGSGRNLPRSIRCVGGPHDGALGLRLYRFRMEVPMNAQFKEQQCNVAGLALSWIGYAAGLGYFSYQHRWVAALLWMVGMLCLRWALFHFFPRISRFLGYGQIVDKFASIPPPHANPRATPIAVNFYS